MKAETLNVHYIIDEKISIKRTTMFYEQLDEDDMHNIHFEMDLNHQHIQSKPHATAEYAVKYFQKELPDNVRIACCQSCRHGNFNPFGDVENELFCLKDRLLHNREDVVAVFSNQEQNFESRSRKLLDYCKDYQPLCDEEKYTYNDWGLGDLF